MGGDEEMETLWSSQKSLQEIIEPKNFKSYDELKTKMYKVLALDGGIHAPTNTAEDDDLGMDFTPKFQERSAPTMETAPSPAISSSNNDDDDTLEFFKGLAND